MQEWCGHRRRNIWNHVLWQGKNAGKSLPFFSYLQLKVFLMDAAHLRISYVMASLQGFGENCTPRGQCTFGARLQDEEIKLLAEFVKSQADRGWPNVKSYGDWFLQSKRKRNFFFASINCWTNVRWDANIDISRAVKKKKNIKIKKFVLGCFWRTIRSITGIAKLLCRWQRMGITHWLKRLLL